MNIKAWKYDFVEGRMGKGSGACNIKLFVAVINSLPLKF
jgi:hypothetical protein